ncbi:MAG: LptF/LptG family permease, partial [Magnetococcales bacterium]|nr:LptF/LptG family permease [Magnetococcales bacterium]
MPLLYRYLLGLFWGTLLRIMGAFSGLFLLLDGAEQMRRASGPGRVIPWGDLMLMLFLRLPDFLIRLAAPMAMLAALITLAQLGRRQELTAARAGGVSLTNLLTPFLLGAGMLGVIQWGAYQFVMPHAHRVSDKIEDRVIRGRPVTDQAPGEFWSWDEGRVIHARRVERKGQELVGVAFYRLDEGFRLREVNEGARAEAESGGWRLREGVSRHYAEDGTARLERFESRFVKSSLAPRTVRDPAPAPEHMSYVQLWEYIERMAREGLGALSHRMALHRRIAEPAATMAAVLLAFPFALRLQRLGGVGVSL